MFRIATRWLSQIKTEVEQPAMLSPLLLKQPGSPLPQGMQFLRVSPACIATLLFALLNISTTDAQADTGSRASAFEYDAVSGLLTKEIIEPDDPNLCLVTSYTYDSFGNKLSATARNCNGSAGANAPTNTEAAAPTTATQAGTDATIVARTSSTTYDAQGRFPVTSTNALSQTEIKTYNANYGTVATLTGPNNLTISWTYDSFGRPLN